MRLGWVGLRQLARNLERALACAACRPSLSRRDFFNPRLSSLPSFRITPQALLRLASRLNAMRTAWASKRDAREVRGRGGPWVHRRAFGSMCIYGTAVGRCGEREGVQALACYEAERAASLMPLTAVPVRPVSTTPLLRAYRRSAGGLL